MSPLSWPYNLVLLMLPAAHVVRCLRVRRFTVGVTLVAVLIELFLFVPDRLWSGVGRLVVAPGARPDETLPPLAGLITYAPGLAAGALGILLAWLTRWDSDTGPAPASTATV